MTQIKLNKAKLAKLFIFSLLFLLAGFWMAVKNPEIKNPFFNSPVVKYFAAYGGIIMGVFGTYYCSKKLFDIRPGVIIDENGIVDNTSWYTFGLIPWGDVAEIYGSSIQASMTSKQHFVTIALHNPQFYIDKETNVIKKKLLVLNLNNYGSPIHISTNTLKINHTDFLNLVSTAFNKYKSQGEADQVMFDKNESLFAQQTN